MRKVGKKKKKKKKALGDYHWREQLGTAEREGRRNDAGTRENWNDELQGAAMNQSPATGGAPTNNAGPPFLGAHQG